MIRQGAFDWVAAQAAGIAPTTFREWMARGEGRDPERPPTNEYAAFAAQVRQARAAARSKAEITVRQDNPLAWLRYGPGRDKPNEPGWTESAQVSHDVSGEVVVVDMEAVKKKRWAEVAPVLKLAMKAKRDE
ncbi:MAG: hypothetical protein MOGMAGMI_02509 [Candidatus Omnitrophica bacterium]|nr:hypothetical protein [Candidatus Omnitrophota bacterium]